MLKLSRIYKEHCNALTSGINHVDSACISTSGNQLMITIISAYNFCFNSKSNLITTFNHIFKICSLQNEITKQYQLLFKKINHLKQLRKTFEFE